MRLLLGSYFVVYRVSQAKVNFSHPLNPLGSSKPLDHLKMETDCRLQASQTLAQQGD